jgi:hypothetical protein
MSNRGKNEGMRVLDDFVCEAIGGPDVPRAEEPASRSHVMNVASLDPHEVEEDRQRQVRELSADSGEKWLVEYGPGSFGCHELLDRTAMVADILEEHILTHPACVARSAWYLLAEQAAVALRELYQQVGAEHLMAEKPNREGS